MDISDWISNQFGGTDKRTLLDEDIYSSESLREDRTGLERKLSQLDDELENHETRYEHFIHKGAESDDMEKQKFAQKARFEKKKHAVKKKKYKQVSIKLGAVISIEGAREILSMKDQQEYQIDNHFDADLAPDELSEQIRNQMVEWGLNMEDMQDIQQALDVEVLDDQLEMDASEEEKLMQEMEAGKISDQRISLDGNEPEETDESEVESKQSSNLNHEPLDSMDGDIDAESDIDVDGEIDFDIGDEKLDVEDL